jgi:hypothetical protein
LSNFTSSIYYSEYLRRGGSSYRGEGSFLGSRKLLKAAIFFFFSFPM